MTRFAGQTAIVTGAGSGIGRATAERLVAEGARVVANDVSEERLDNLAAELGNAVVTVTGDVTDPDTIAAIMAAADGTVDCLANVAGIMDGFLPPDEVDDATWDRVMTINVTGPMRLTRAVLPVMIAAGHGTIVNVASEGALRGSSAGAAYTTSKHAVVGLSKSVAFYHGPAGVRCNVVCPGGVRTNIEGSMKSQAAAQRVGPVLQATMQGVAAASEIAAAITWLLSADSSNVNGAVLPSDGGWSVV